MSAAIHPRPNVELGSSIIASMEGVTTLRLRHYDNIISSLLVNTNNSMHSIESALLEEADATRTLTARFNQRLNRLRCPILRLPPEIMQLIIYAIVDSNDRAHGDPKGWISLGRVCHEFRATLLGMHALWGRVAFSSHTIPTEVLLERAHDAPIVVKLDTNSRPPHFRLALQHISRACEIDGLGGLRLESFICELQEQDLPLLRSLDLKTLHTSDHSISWAFPVPNLRVICLTNVNISAGLYWPVNLTKLALHGSLPESSNLSRTAAFVDMLRSCASLQELEVDGQIPDLGDLSDEETLGPIPLCSLRTISLTQDCASILQLWKMLILPPTTLVAIEFEDLLDGVLLMSCIKDTQVFSSHVTAYSGVMPPISALKISGSQSVNDDDWLCLSIYGAYCGTNTAHRLDRSDTEWTRVAAFTFTTRACTGDALAAAIARFSSIHSLSQITYLYVDADIGGCFQYCDLYALYEPYKAIQTLHLDYCDGPILLYPLEDISDKDAEHPEVPRLFVACPALKTLYLSDSGARAGFRTLRHLLRDILQRRAEKGFRVKLLGLAYNNVSESHQEQLSNFVDTIRIYD